MTVTPKHSVSVAGIVVNSVSEVLVIRRRDNGHWEPPGGVLELDESPQAGTVREVLEETGLQVKVDRLCGVYKNLTQGVVALVFKCSPVAGTPQPTLEATTSRWISLQQVEDLMDPVYAIRVIDAFGELEEAVAVRTHDGVRFV